MTKVLSSVDDRPDRGTYSLAMMSARAPVPDGLPPWPGRVRCDLVDVPLDVCCGVIAHLERAEGGLCPVAQVGNRMLFMTAVGSGAARADRIAGLPAGVVVHGAVDGFPSAVLGGRTGSCWVIEAQCPTPVLPSADTVLGALVSAYAEYQAATSKKII